ncbi:MAG: hypothetical protein KDC38_07645, partial [Planctomycetes bacterium]|nr:hypothetical protein [Planctomycetota bacterium]
MCSLFLSSCNNGGGGGGGGTASPTATACDGVPLVLGTQLYQGCAEDEIVVRAVNLAPDFEANRARFIATDGGVVIEGPILDVAQVGVGASGCPLFDLLVLVPSGARTGVVEIWSRNGDGEWAIAGVRSFEACPEILGFGIGTLARPWLESDTIFALLTTQLQLFGHGMSELTGVRVIGPDGLALTGV